MRAIGLDVHRDFCEVAIAEGGKVRSAGRIATTPGGAGAVRAEPGRRMIGWRLEVTGNAWEIARIIEPHVARVVVVSPSDTGIRQARAKTDRLDARTLAQAAGARDRWTRCGCPTSARGRCAVGWRAGRSWCAARTRAKNEIHAVLDPAA